MRGKEGTLKQMRAELTVAITRLETLRLRAKKVEKEKTIVRIDVSSQTTLCEDAREQSCAKVGDLEEVQSRLYKREDKLITMHGARNKVAAEL